MSESVHDELIAEALRAGIRAQGVKFRTALYRAVLLRCSAEEVKAFAADWNAVGDFLFPATSAEKSAERELIARALEDDATRGETPAIAATLRLAARRIRNGTER